MATVNFLSISGGKDSTAMWLYALETKLEGDILPVFADTGHEHPMTYEYLDYLESKLGPIRRIKADFSEQIARKREWVQTKWREEGIPEEIIQSALEVLHPTGIPFLDLCLWKGRFPSTKARFCTQFLKREPVFNQIYLPLMDEGKRVVSWQGVRAQESPARAKLPEREETPEGFEIYRPLLKWTVKLPEREETPEGFEIYRPLLKWTVEDVFNIHKRHGIEPNPLYLQGMSRVGCMPCINCQKSELYEIARRYPEEIERVAKWEKIVSKASKRASATFFCSTNDWGENIYEAVEWSKTGYGGKQYDLFKVAGFEDVPVCSSVYGLCE